jgi:hypothetical protein
MREMELELIEEISNNRNFKKCSYIEDLILELYESDSGSLDKIQKKFHCSISRSIEKHNQLQYTYYYTITSDLISGELQFQL